MNSQQQKARAFVDAKIKMVHLIGAGGAHGNAKAIFCDCEFIRLNTYQITSQ